jgi:enoyl-CoA hydratase
MPEYSTIVTETHNRVGLVRLNRPQAMNALSRLLLLELMEALMAFDTDEAIGALVIAGSERLFSVGADIKEMSDTSAIEMFLQDRASLFDRIRLIKKPIIAAVSGLCLGGGCELVLSCDMVIAAQSARFGQPEINLGVIPGAGATQRLTRAAGKALAMEMILNNRTLTAAEALHFSLVNRVVPPERCLDEALILADEIAGRAPVAIRLAKEAINNAFESSLSDGLADERRAFYFLFATEDQKEGMAAFMAKRKPEWKGR